MCRFRNATVYKSTIKNFSSNPNRRATFMVGIGYESSTSKAQKLINQVLREHSAVLSSPEPLVLVEELGAATANLRINYWFNSGIHSPAKINSALLRQTKNVLLESGIDLPDAAREIVFPKGIPVTMLNNMSEQSGPQPAAPRSQETAIAGADARDSTEGEGNLSSETKEVSEHAETVVPEGRENLLKS